MEVVDTCHQLIGVVGIGLYHSMVDVQSMVSQTVDPVVYELLRGGQKLA